MGYTSSLLGSNVVSSYLHIDNLRNDITTAKTFAPLGVKYLQVSHDDTNAKIVSSSGRLDLYSGNTYLRIHESAGTHYLGIEVGAAGGVTFSNSASIIRFSPVTAQTECWTSGTASSFAVFDVDRTHRVELYCQTASGSGILSSDPTEPLLATATSKRFRFWNGTTDKCDLELYDTVLTRWTKVYISNGAWVIAAV